MLGISNWFKTGIAALVLLSVTACEMAESMRIRSGLDPSNVDDDVRFRTNYYFTVLTMCFDQSGKPMQIPGFPIIDSIYRYQMTGKAHSLTTNVRFESGTVDAAVIDRLGAAGRQIPTALGTDPLPSLTPTQAGASPPTSGAGTSPAAATPPAGLLTGTALGTAVQSALTEATQTDTDTKAIQTSWKTGMAAIPAANAAEAKTVTDAITALEAASKSLMGLAGIRSDDTKKWETELTKSAAAYKNLTDAWTALIATSPTMNTALTAVDTAIKGYQQRQTTDASQAKLIASLSLHNRAMQIIALQQQNLALQAKVRPADCLGQLYKDQVFAVLGPEGWRLIDPSTRLAMAMSSSDKPLIDSLNKTAAIARQAHNGGAGRVIPFLRAETDAVQMISTTQQQSEAEAFKTLLDQSAANLDSAKN